jgi:hypothetical protein
MEGVIDIWCRGQEEGLCISLKNLNGASMGCGFIKNKRAAVELFQVKLSNYGKPFNVKISVYGSQLLQMLKFSRERNGEVSRYLDCKLINSLILVWKEMLVSLTKNNLDSGVNMASCVYKQLERNSFGELEQKSELMEDDVDVLCQGRVIGFCRSYRDLDGASIGCGFIKNRRAAVQLFQVKYNVCGETVYIVMSTIESQLLKMLKASRRRSGK